MSRFDNVIDLKLDAVITVGAEAANVINVAIQLVDRLNGNALASRAAVGFYLADDANGDTPSTVAPSGGVAIGTDGAAIETVADLAGTLISESDGDIDLDITEAGAKTYYLVLIMPDGKLVVSDAITFA